MWLRGASDPLYEDERTATMPDETKADEAKGKEQRTVLVTVRTPAGAPHEFNADLHERVDKLVREAVRYFVSQNLLENGDYSLALVRNGTAVNLEDEKRLQEYGVVKGDVFHLIPKRPQVDG